MSGLVLYSCFALVFALTAGRCLQVYRNHPQSDEARYGPRGYLVFCGIVVVFLAIFHQIEGERARTGEIGFFAIFVITSALMFFFSFPKWNRQLREQCK